MGLKRCLCLVLPVLIAVCRCASPAAVPAPLRPQPQAPASTPTPSSTEPVVEGESVEAAVIVPADNEEDGIAFENEWIFQHYGRFRRRSGRLASLAGRRYDVITVELSDHTQRTLYFDITDFYGRERKPK